MTELQLVLLKACLSTLVTSLVLIRRHVLLLKDQVKESEDVLWLLLAVLVCCSTESVIASKNLYYI